jgi:hypothetical protein
VEASLWAATESAYDPFDERKIWQAIHYYLLKSTPSHTFSRVAADEQRGVKLIVVRRMSMVTIKMVLFSRSYFVCASFAPIDAVCDSRMCATQIC